MNSEKQKSNRIKSFLRSRLQVVREFTETTTSHGIPHIVSANNMYEIKKNYLDNILYLSIVYKTKVYKQISTNLLIG